MSETLEYIEAYFEKKLSDAEKQAFEQRCAEDEDFATEVAFYITSREAIRLKLLEQKNQTWLKTEPEEIDSVLNNVLPINKTAFKKWLPYAAAACLLVAIAMYFLYPAETSRQLADEYVRNTLSHISQTMDGGSKDSLQNGISYYNKGKYDSALYLFQNIYQANPNNNEAKENIGLAYLMKKDYGKALLAFDELANKKLYSNSGFFLKAVTLLERNEQGDKETAKALLNQVIDQQLEGKKEAMEWLRKW